MSNELEIIINKLIEIGLTREEVEKRQLLFLEALLKNMKKYEK